MHKHGHSKTKIIEFPASFRNKHKMYLQIFIRGKCHWTPGILHCLLITFPCLWLRFLLIQKAISLHLYSPEYAMNSQLKITEIRDRKANLLLHSCTCYSIKKWQCKTETVTNVHISYLQNLVSCWSHGHLFAAAALTLSGEIWWCQGFVSRLGYQEEKSTAMSPEQCLRGVRARFTPFTLRTSPLRPWPSDCGSGWQRVIKNWFLHSAYSFGTCDNSSTEKTFVWWLFVPVKFSLHTAVWGQSLKSVGWRNSMCG